MTNKARIRGGKGRAPNTFDRWSNFEQHAERIWLWLDQESTFIGHRVL